MRKVKCEMRWKEKIMKALPKRTEKEKGKRLREKKGRKNKRMKR